MDKKWPEKYCILWGLNVLKLWYNFTKFKKVYNEILKKITVRALLNQFFNAYIWSRHVFQVTLQTGKPVRSENLTSGQMFFKEGLIWLVRGNSFSKEPWSDMSNTIREWEGTPHHFFVRTTNDVTTHSPLILPTTSFFCPSVASYSIQKYYFMPFNNFF